MTSARHVPPGRQPHWRLVHTTLLVFALGAAWAFAANPAPADPDFPAYAAKHQGDLQPVFALHGCDMLKDGLPILISVAGDILLATALIGWVLDVPLMWGFSTIFAPAYAKFTRALIYACGRLVLAMMMTVILELCGARGGERGRGAACTGGGGRADGSGGHRTTGLGGLSLPHAAAYFVFVLRRAAFCARDSLRHPRADTVFEAGRYSLRGVYGAKRPRAGHAGRGRQRAKGRHGNRREARRRTGARHGASRADRTGPVRRAGLAKKLSRHGEILRRCFSVIS